MAHGDVNGLLRRRGYDERRKIGEGSFGKALLVESRDDRQQFVCKMVDVSKASRKEAEDAAKEAMLLSKLRHPYIVRYHESFTDHGWLCILMDFCECGDLAKKISEARKSRSPMAEPAIMKMFTQAISALKYIHDQHILHRDLKPQNFFIAKNGDLKMGDFGIAKVLACTIAVARTQIGTPYYLSPELCQEKPYTWPSDIWAMGCILYELCALKVPFDAPNIPGLVQKIIRGPLPKVPNQYSDFVRGLAESMLNRNQDKRPSTEQILDMDPIKTIMQSMVADHVPQVKRTPTTDRDADAAAGAPPPPAADDSSGAEGGGADRAGNYYKGDLVEYLSTAHKSWLPAKVMNTNASGGIIIDLKPNTWITRDEQITRVRPRQADEPKAAPAPAPGVRRTPSVGSARGASPMNAPGRAASPRGGAGGIGRTPSNGGLNPPAPYMNRSPSMGSANGRPPSMGGVSPMMNRSPSGGRPASGRAESPMLNRSPSAGSGVGSAGPAPLWGAYKVGDQVEFLSTSHKEWLPATIIRVDSEGRIIIDLKPNTWITKEEQQNRVRPKAKQAPAYQKQGGGSRQASPMLNRNPSADRGYPGQASPGSGCRAGTPSRAASPRRALSRDAPPSRGASPRGGAGGVGPYGTPRRPPGMPPARAASPLRSGGRSIAGMS